MPTIKAKHAGIKTSFPGIIKPMLCTLVREPFNKEGWLYEIKWDGYRILAYKHKNNVTLRSRSGLDYSDRYASVYSSLKKLNSDFILDGEIVAFDAAGKISFDAVQGSNPSAKLAYYVFDILYKDGYSIMQLPLIERKNILKNFLSSTDTVIKFSDHFTDGNALYEQAIKLELEGIVCKKEHSVYTPGKRGDEWLKIPTMKRQEFVIGGWAESEKARSFRSLLFGAYNSKGEFEWIGRSGGGFKEKDMPGILKKLQALEIKQSPFTNKILDTKGAILHYVKPLLVANFQFATWTVTGRIRKPATFLAFRSDKKAKDVVREVPLSITKEKKVIEETKPLQKSKHLKTMPGSNWPELEKIPVTSHDEIPIDDCTIQLTNVEREIWKGITKADLITYYNQIAGYILLHIKNRPLSLHIKPYGATEKGLYIKDMEGRQPSCAEIFSTKRKHPKAGKRSTIDYLVCNNKATLLWLINLGCIDINPWSSTTKDYLHTDYIIIDLDPSDEDFKKAITTALAAKQFFDEHNLKSFIKTSGKTGLHILLPCHGFTFADARKIAVNICNEIHQLVPSITTTNISINQRGNKLFIDPSQNDEADTIAAAYSCRPYVLPTVSTPLEWKEVKASITPEAFTIKTILKRIEKKRDLWQDLFNKKLQNINNAILHGLLSK